MKKDTGHPDVIALIPARGGSKGIPRKNIMPLGGYPLLAYPIAAAILSKHISRIVVTTDDEEIATVARAYGAETPFMRPKEISGDKSLDIEFVEHAIKWLREHEGTAPEYLVELRTTTPLRRPQDVDAAIELIKNHPEATSLRSGYELQEPPQKLFGIGSDGYFAGLYPDDPRPEYFNLPRQTFPPAYQPDGYVDILRTSHIEREHTQHGNKMLAFKTEDTGELDSPSRIRYVRFKLQDETWEVYEWLKKNFKPLPEK